MRRQDACGASGRHLADVLYLFEHAAEGTGSAGNRCRTERRDAVPRQLRRNRRYRAASIERIDAVDAVHVDVDEAGNDAVAVESKRRQRVATRDCSRNRPGPNLSDAIAVDDEGAGRKNPVRQHELGA